MAARKTEQKQAEANAFNKHEISLLFACLSKPTILMIIEALASSGPCSRENFIRIEGISAFTVQQNLRYLKRLGLVHGSLNPDAPYSLDFEKIKNIKMILDDFYRKIASYNDVDKDKQEGAV